MVTHIRVDDETLNSKRKFACGIGPELPPGDKYYFAAEAMAGVMADCPGCNPNPRRLGTPLSELSGRPDQPGYEKLKAIAKSWGYD